MKKYESLTEYVSRGAFYKAVVEDGSDIIFIVDFSGNILYHNDSVEETLGHEPKSLIGNNFYDFIQKETLDSFRKSFQLSQTKLYDENVEFIFQCQDGAYKYLEFNSINLKLKEGVEGMLLDCRDITQRKKDAEELLRAQRAKEEFLANMSHEIRTPINGIAGMVNLLLEVQKEEDRIKYLNAIKHSTENLKVIINDILDFSMIESGKLRLEKIGFLVKSHVESVIETFRHQAIDKGLALEFFIEEEADVVVIGDPVRLSQILINLISNAIKFTHDGYIKISILIVHKEERSITLEFQVSDTGVGIPQEKLNTIFDSFSQADESITRRYGGTGLGLTISRQLVELQGGEITVTSTESYGSTFSFSIPYLLGNIKDIEKDIKVPNKKITIRFPQSKVLLVEDNDINRLYATNLLKNWNCTVDSAENGLIALEKLKANQYDIIFMDIQMPVMDGYEATKTIRATFEEDKRDIPIIAITANAIKGDDDKSILVGMNDYIIKPFQPDDLRRVLQKFLLKKDRITRSPEKSNESTLANNTKINLNLAYLINVSNNDPVFLKEMLDTMSASIPRSLSELDNAYKQKAWKEVARIAHSLKPSMNFLGLQELRNDAVIIEEWSKNQKNLDKIKEKIIRFTSGCEIAVKKIRDLKL